MWILWITQGFFNGKRTILPIVTRYFGFHLKSYNMILCWMGLCTFQTSLPFFLSSTLINNEFISFHLQNVDNKFMSKFDWTMVWDCFSLFYHSDCNINKMFCSLYYGFEDVSTQFRFCCWILVEWWKSLPSSSSWKG
jgi:hypothetical protein